MEKKIKRGDIYYADLSPVRGSEQAGLRPVVNIQNEVGNRYSPTIIVAAITSRTKTGLPTHVSLYGVEGLESDSVILLEQLRTIDRIRLLDYVTTVDHDIMEKIDDALCISLDLPGRKKGRGSDGESAS